MPSRSQFNRAVRRWHERFGALAVHLGQQLVDPDGLYEVLDSTGVATRNAQRRGLGWLAETFLAGRAHQQARLGSVGQPTNGWYLADGGFTGLRWEQHWAAAYAARVICPPERNHRRSWSASWRAWLATHRQIIETVTDRLLSTFGLARERPHTLSGFLARLGARVGLHNTCLWCNQQVGRPLLAMADLMDW